MPITNRLKNAIFYQTMKFDEKIIIYMFVVYASKYQINQFRVLKCWNIYKYSQWSNSQYSKLSNLVNNWLTYDHCTLIIWWLWKSYIDMLSNNMQFYKTVTAHNCRNVILFQRLNVIIFNGTIIWLYVAYLVITCCYN